MSVRNPKHENEFLNTNSILEPLVVKACGKEYLAIGNSGHMIHYLLREKDGIISCYINNVKVLDLKENCKLGDSLSIN